MQRALLLCFGLVVGVLLLEGALRVAALVIPPRLERAAAPVEELPVPGETRVLCIGDSHTYGVGVEPAESYPAQLEAVLRARGVRVRVVNAGVPGRNSTQLREVLPAKIAQYHPQIVLVWVGANNQWMPLDDKAPAPAMRLRDRFRLVRFLRLLLGRNEGVSGDFRRELDDAQAAVGETPQVQGQPGSRSLRSVEATAELTRRDLDPIVETIRAAGAVPVLLTYPVTLGPLLTAIDKAVLEAGATSRARVIDLQVMARRHVRRVRKLLQPDMHPTARFYRAIGWEIARTLVRERVIPPSPAQ